MGWGILTGELVGMIRKSDGSREKRLFDVPCLNKRRRWGDENSRDPFSGGKGCSWVGEFENARFKLSGSGRWGENGNGNGSERRGMRGWG